MALFQGTFVEKMNELCENGVELQRQGRVEKYKVYCICSSVDSVARAPMQGVTQFNGYFGCNWCLQRGERAGGATKYPVEEVEPTERSELQMLNDMEIALKGGVPVQGVKTVSPLINLPHFNIVWSFVPDYMHCVLLGVARQFLELWFNSDSACSISRHQHIVDRRLMSIKPPMDVKRLPRPTKERKWWKAKELESWLLCYSVPVLHGILEKPYMQHWACLVEALHIMLQRAISPTELTIAEGLLLEFHVRAELLFGKSVMTFNMHQLTHIAKSVRHWGPLWAHSAFPFEAGNGSLKKAVKAANGIPHQVCRVLQMESMVVELQRQAISPSVAEYCSSFDGTKTQKSVLSSGGYRFFRTRFPTCISSRSSASSCDLPRSIMHNSRNRRPVSTCSLVSQKSKCASLQRRTFSWNGGSESQHRWPMEIHCGYHLQHRLASTSPNEPRRRHNWRAVRRFNFEALEFNLRLLCHQREGVFYVNHRIDALPPWTVLAGDGVHPSFTGVSLLAWNFYNLLFDLRWRYMNNWLDHAPQPEAYKLWETPSCSQALRRDPPCDTCRGGEGQTKNQAAPNSRYPSTDQQILSGPPSRSTRPPSRVPQLSTPPARHTPKKATKINPGQQRRPAVPQSTATSGQNQTSPSSKNQQPRLVKSNQQSAAANSSRLKASSSREAQRDRAPIQTRYDPSGTLWLYSPRLYKVTYWLCEWVNTVRFRKLGHRTAPNFLRLRKVVDKRIQHELHVRSLEECVLAGQASLTPDSPRGPSAGDPRCRPPRTTARGNHPRQPPPAKKIRSYLMPHQPGLPSGVTASATIPTMMMVMGVTNTREKYTFEFGLCATHVRHEAQTTSQGVLAPPPPFPES
ncbi:hypothetical protein HPB51_003474 [Rhipicephalus microplus]|uniref:Uncharacterized protein n=1 Tax=Rhipicephalus microplus TaxID=6941 RepID=A0A9J6EF44_RHIMP|nr:hypothetical protein HPB51_003474 [Rhipicephalus microplus]